MASTIGLLVGIENTFRWPFIERVNEKGRADGIEAEMAILGPPGEVDEPRYAVIVDRISHEVPFYRAHLKSAALMGTVVVNDPFWWNADEKFFECTLARKLGVAVPKTVVLPNKESEAGIDPNRSLRNMQYPVDWEAVASYIGLPAVLKPNTGGGWRNVYVVWSMEELLHAYDQTGQLTMILQEFIDWDDYVRCIPWTRRLCAGPTLRRGEEIPDLLEYVADHKDELVLKPNDEFGGKGVVLGWTVEQHEWEQDIEVAFTQSYVVQERVPVPRPTFPVSLGGVHFLDFSVDTDPYLLDGAVCGSLTRISSSALLNVTAGAGSIVPLYVIDGRWS